MFQAARQKLLRGNRSSGLSATNTRASPRTTREGCCPVCSDSSPSPSGSRSDSRGQPSVGHMGHEPVEALVDDTGRQEPFQQGGGTPADNQTLLWECKERLRWVSACSQPCLLFSIFLSARLAPTERPPAGQTPPIRKAKALKKKFLKNKEVKMHFPNRKHAHISAFFPLSTNTA